MQTYYDKYYTERIESYITALANDKRFANCDHFITVSFNIDNCNINFKDECILQQPLDFSDGKTGDIYYLYLPWLKYYLIDEKEI